jgi:glutamate dehydrogenase
MLTANMIVNDLGVTWASRLGTETGAESAEVARAYWIARHVTGAERRWADVEALDGKIDPGVQNVLMVGVDSLVEDVARWYLLAAPGASLGDTIEEAAPVFSALSSAIETAGSEAWREAREAIVRELVAVGVPEPLARRHAYQPELAHGPDIIAVTKATSRTLEEVASAFYLAGDRFHLDWLERRLVELPDGSRFERWARQAVGDDLMTLRRDIALRVLDSADGRPIDRAMEDYLQRRTEAYERLNRLVNALAVQDESSLAALTVALRQVRGLVA